MSMKKIQELKPSDPIEGSIRIAMPSPYSAIDMQRHNRMEAAQRAAGMVGYTKESYQQMAAGLHSLIEYRAQVAIQLLRLGSSEGEAAKALTELLEYCNVQIKEYLAIP